MRKKKREPTSQRKLRSRRMSVPHAESAIRPHDRPRRDLAERPSCTRMTTTSIVASSTAPSAIVAIAYWWNATPSAAMIDPVTIPRVWKMPSIPEASPTWGSGTRSGT
jgi:hypothetical protein